MGGVLKPKRSKNYLLDAAKNTTVGPGGQSQVAGKVPYMNFLQLREQYMAEGNQFNYVNDAGVQPNQGYVISSKGGSRHGKRKVVNMPNYGGNFHNGVGVQDDSRGDGTQDTMLAQEANRVS